MGCVSSKLIKKDLKQELLYGNGDYINHVVSLTSSTYGVLKLDISGSLQIDQKPQEDALKVVCVKAIKSSPQREEPEVINAWELMGDLEEGMPISSKKSPKPIAEIGVRRSPFKYLNQINSPKWARKNWGKENKSDEFTPKRGGLLMKSWNSIDSSKKLLMSSKGSRKTPDSPRKSFSCSSRRRSLTPLFDPDLIETFEKELSQEQDEIKQMVSQSPRSRNSSSILETYELKCPPGGESSIVIYTTTLRGIRKTFEDCSSVRSIIESYRIQMIERDVSMHSGFKEELRELMGTKEVKVPAVFVKGRLIGGAEEVRKLEEDGRLEILFDGIPKAAGSVCGGCGGIRFVMCRECSGSCKVLDEKEKKMVKCCKCNENGLIQCPLCC